MSLKFKGHTPGPWTFIPCTSTEFASIKCSRGYTVVSIDVVSEPNLALMAAAPELSAVNEDLVMLVKRLVQSLKKANLNEDLQKSALDYLQRKNLISNLR